MTTSPYWRGKRTLVTGASGFVGRNLVPLLAEAACDLVAPSRSDYNLLEQADVRRGKEGKEAVPRPSSRVRRRWH